MSVHVPPAEFIVHSLSKRNALKKRKFFPFFPQRRDGGVDLWQFSVSTQALDGGSS